MTGESRRKWQDWRDTHDEDDMMERKSSSSGSPMKSPSPYKRKAAITGEGSSKRRDWNDDEDDIDEFCT